MVAATVSVAAVDLFMRTPKSVVGADSPPKWADGYVPGEVVTYYPLEIAGEQGGAKLMVVGFPRAEILKFRLGILIPGAVCRLDHTDETHANSWSNGSDGIPYIVRGPHYHSWPLNRRFCRGGSLPQQLHNADVCVAGRTFDATLRWFCADNHIDALPPGHRIELPKRELLI